MSGAPCPKIPRPVKVQRGLQRTPMKRKAHKRDNEFTAKIKAAASARAGGQCEWRGPVCTNSSFVHHHILGRGQGGPGTLENCAHICDACHKFAHANRRLAFEKGWIVRGLQVPEAM